MKTSRIVRLAVTVLFVAMLVMQVGGMQGAQAATPGVTKVTADQAAAMALWTRSAMANAKPLPMPVDKGTPHGAVGKVVSQAPGAPGSTPAGAADPNAAAIAKAAYAADWQAAGMDTLADAPVDAPASGGGTNTVYTSYYANQQNMQKMIPHQMVGRLYISGTPGSGYCSATAISGNDIVTAAHCVYDLGAHHFFSSWAFSPAYRTGSAPYGTFYASTCWVLNAWIAQPYYSISGATPYDVAVCHMGNNSAGKSLNYMVGNAGRTWNLSYDLNIHNMGYPWNDYRNIGLANAGQYLRLCTAETWEEYVGVVGMGCNLGGGISGGSWMPNYAPYQTGSINQVDSVNSGIYIGYKGIYGIYFSTNNIVALCASNAAKC